MGVAYGADSIFTTLFLASELKPSGAFTPNGDGINDTWFVENAELLDGHVVVIYNIFGQEVFRQSGYDNNNGWNGQKDGKQLPAGEYYYLIKGPTYTKRGAVVIVNQ